MHMVVRQYLDYLKHEKRLSVNTLKAYQRDLLDFQDFLARDDSSTVEQTKTRQIRRFVLDGMSKGWEPKTTNRKISALKGCFLI